MRKLLTILPIVGLLVFGVMLNAGATEGECATFENHSGHVPGSYDYAEFYEDGQLVTTVETNGEDTFVDPADFDAGESWDQVNKCHNGEAPPPAVSVDCVTLTIDAAEGVTYGVQIGDGFVETEGTQTFVGSAGQAWAVFFNGQTLASGVFEECTTTTTEQVTTTTAPEETTTTAPETTTTVDVTTTTEAPTTTTTPDAPELPFTGPAAFVGLLLAGSALVGVGVSTVRASKWFSE